MLNRFNSFNLNRCAGTSGGSLSDSRRARRRWARLASVVASALAVSSVPARGQSYNVSPPVILQDFDSSYLSIENKMPDIFESGYGAVYLPPPGYSTTTNSVGYDVYNRFDLGTAAAAHNLRHPSRITIRDPGDSFVRRQSVRRPVVERHRLHGQQYSRLCRLGWISRSGGGIARHESKRPRLQHTGI